MTDTECGFCEDAVIVIRGEERECPYCKGEPPDWDRQFDTREEHMGLR